MKDWDRVEELRKAWQERVGTDRPSEACPSPEAIWEALRGGLSGREVARIVRHTASCPDCAEAWRLAHEMGAMEGRAVAQPQFERRRAAPLLLRPLALAAGLALLVGIGAFLLVGRQGREGGEPEVAPGAALRNTGAKAIRTLAPEDEPRPRDACRLTWSPGPEGSRYTVRITTFDLETIDLAEGILDAEYTVPAAALRQVPPGARLLWQVQIRYPDGRHATSPTFFLTVQ